MRTGWGSIVALAALALVGCQAASSAAPVAGPVAAASPPRELRVGDQAPDFTLLDQNRQPITLSQLRGRPAQVAFYVWAFSGG
jgi:cytochrome oxidase Cu insertion factor (SCO1/SenC/PrrC family)